MNFKLIQVLALLSSVFSSHSALAGVGQVTLYLDTSTHPPPAKSLIIQGPHPRTIQKSGDIMEGDKLFTGTGQTAKITFLDESEVWMTPQTTLTVEHSSNTPGQRLDQLFMESGLTRSLVKKIENDPIKFQIRTQAAVMGVRGTEFVTEQDQTGKTTLYTLDGAVAYGRTPQDLQSDQTSRVITKSNQSEMLPGQKMPSAPKAFNPIQLKQRLAKVSPHLAKSVHDEEEKRSRGKAPVGKPVHDANHPEEPARKESIHSEPVRHHSQARPMQSAPPRQADAGTTQKKLERQGEHRKEKKRKRPAK